MNKMVKSVIVAGIFSVAIGGVAFAKDKNINRCQMPQQNFQMNKNFQNGKSMNNRNSKADFQKNKKNRDRSEKIGKNNMMIGMFGNSSEKIMGTVEAVYVNEKKIKIVDADNKSTEIVVNGFSKLFGDSKKELKLSDIKAGSDIFVCIFDTKTSTKVAAAVFVKSE